MYRERLPDHRRERRGFGARRQRRRCAAQDGGVAQAGPDQGFPRPVRHRSGRRQALYGRGRLQPLQAAALRSQGGRGGDRQVEYRAGGAYGYGQDADGPHDRQIAEGALHHRGRHGADRGGLRGRGCREHPFAAAAGRRLQRRAGRTGHRLHRRDRQDRPQGR